MQVTYHLENLARNNDNTQSSPVKVQSKPKNADRQDLLPAKFGEVNGRTAWSDEPRAFLLRNGHGVHFLVYMVGILLSSKRLACSSAAAKACTLSKRSLASLASALITTCSTAGEIEGTLSRKA